MLHAVDVSKKSDNKIKVFHFVHFFIASIRQPRS